MYTCVKVVHKSEAYSTWQSAFTTGNNYLALYRSIIRLLLLNIF